MLLTRLPLLQWIPVLKFCILLTVERKGLLLRLTWKYIYWYLFQKNWGFKIEDPFADGRDDGRSLTLRISNFESPKKIQNHKEMPRRKSKGVEPAGNDHSEKLVGILEHLESITDKSYVVINRDSSDKDITRPLYSGRVLIEPFETLVSKQDFPDYYEVIDDPMAIDLIKVSHLDHCIFMATISLTRFNNG